MLAVRVFGLTPSVSELSEEAKRLQLRGSEESEAREAEGEGRPRLGLGAERDLGKPSRAQT